MKQLKKLERTFDLCCLSRAGREELWSSELRFLVPSCKIPEWQVDAVLLVHHSCHLEYFRRCCLLSECVNMFEQRAIWEGIFPSGHDLIFKVLADKHRQLTAQVFLVSILISYILACSHDKRKLAKDSPALLELGWLHPCRSQFSVHNIFLQASLSFQSFWLVFDLNICYV